MKRIFSALVVALCVMLTARAQDTDAHIYGHVIDKNTDEHLPYIVVMLKGTTIGVSTESTGHYIMRNIPEGTFTVEVSSVGYKTQYREINVRKGHSYEVNFTLEEDLVQIDGVIVSATRSETTRRMSPTLVNVVSMDVYNRANATTVAQGLSFQPGVRVENNCQNCGFQQVRINGLDGQYTQILIDSRPIFSALAGVYGIEQLPANMVDRVEVMRGGGSALFGSSAIAGTINIITKEPVRNSAAISHTTTSIDGSGAFDNTTDINASIVSEDNKLGLAVFGQNTAKDAWDANGDGFTELSDISGIDYAKHKVSLLSCNTEILLHLPWTLSCCKMTAGRGKLQVHIISELDIVGSPVKTHYILVRIMVTTCRAVVPYYLFSLRECQMSFCHKICHLIIKSQLDPRHILSTDLTDDIHLGLKHLCDDSPSF